MFSQRIISQSWQRLISSNEGLRSSAIRKSLMFGKDATRTIRNSSKTKQTTPQTNGLGPTPFHNYPSHSGPVPSSNLTKTFIFTCTFSAGCYVGATIYEYENVRTKIKQQIEKSKLRWSLGKSEAQRRGQESDLQKELSLLWSRLTPGEKVFAPLCALNLLVFGLWRVPRLQRFMMTYFCSNPAARIVCWPMFLSTFSHYSMFHIFANMYVLHSFSNAAVMSLGKEQFLGLYLSAGVISSFASYMLKAATNTAGLSLGASGAIMTILAYVCTQYPDTQLGILFIPGFTFSAGAAIKVIMGIDLAGCLLGWKLFDHAAHLGGAVFGVFWALYGKDYLWPKRDYIVRTYHSLRSHDASK